MTSIHEQTHDQHAVDPAGPLDAELLDRDPPTVPLPVIELPVIELPGRALVRAGDTRAVVSYRPTVRVLIGRRVDATAALPVLAAGVARGVLGAPRAAGRGSVVAARAGARHGWFLLAGARVLIGRWRDARGGSRYERLMHAAEVAGDREQVLEWEARAVAERQRRHDRRIAWTSNPAAPARAVGVAVGAVTAALLLLGVILTIGNQDISYLLAPLYAVVRAVSFLWAYGAVVLAVATGGALVYLWTLGRARTEPPAWTTTTTTGGPGGEGRDVVPDEGAIVNALRNLNLPALNKKFREGWSPRWVMPTMRDGQGWRAQVLLPEGVTVEMIVNAKAVLAHNLLRLPVEVWPTEPRDQPGVLDLWVADQGSLTKAVAPWPLLREGTGDYFRGVPVGVDPRGKVIVGRLFQANWGVAGMMGSGKSTLIITALLGAILDPLVEVDVYCMAINADYDPLKPRLRTLFLSDDPDHIPTVLDALRTLMGELSERGRKLSAAGEPKLTRKLAQADPTMRPRVVVIDECQELFVSDVGEEAAELVEKIVAKARKYGVTLIFATPVPSADSLPRKVAKVLSNKACFAIGDHQGNDAILGTGKHRAGITATTLRAMSVDPADGTVDLGDLGTAMVSGFTPADGLMRCFYIPRGDGVDDVTPVVERAMALRDGMAPADPAAAGAVEAQADPLVDIAAVLNTAGVERMRTQEVLSALAAHDRGRYGRWTFTDLRDALPDSAKPYKTRGTQQVSLARVLEALTDRHTTHDDTDTDNDADTDDTGPERVTDSHHE